MKFITQKSQYSFYISLNLSQKRAITQSSLWMTSNFEIDLYFMMLYPSVKFEKIVASLQKLSIGNNN